MGIRAWPIGIILLGCVLGMLMLGDLRSQIPIFFVLFAGASVAYLLGVRWRTALPIWAIAGFGIAFRLALLPLVPTLSDDIYRYAWDGRMQFLGINPYAHAPADDALAPLRDRTLFPHINHAHLPTIYPPVAQAFFFLGYAIAQSIWGIKILIVVADLVAAWLLVRLLRHCERDPRDVLVYFWHPLVIIEGAGSGHVDLLGVAVLMLALLWFAKGLTHRAIAALCGAVLVKFLPVAFLLGFVKRHGFWWREYLMSAGVFCGVILIGYAPYALSGQPVWGSLGTYATEWEFNGLAFGVLRALLGRGDWARGILALGFAAWLCALAWRRTSALRTCYLGSAAFVVLTPTLHPWYALWLVPFLCFFRSHAWTAFTLLIAVSYRVLIRYAAEGVWVEATWVPVVVFGIPACILVGEYWFKWRSKGEGDFFGETP